MPDYLPENATERAEERFLFSYRHQVGIGLETFYSCRKHSILHDNHIMIQQVFPNNFQANRLFLIQKHVLQSKYKENTK